MNRRTFLRAIAAGAPMLLAPEISGAQSRRRLRAGSPDNVQYYVGLPGVEQAVFRYAENQQVSLNEMLFVDGWGFHMRDGESAAVVPGAMAEGYRRWLQEDRGSILNEFGSDSVSVHPDGLGWSATLRVPDSTDEYPWAIIAVQIDEYVQILTGISSSGSAIELLEDLCTLTLERWPNNDPGEPQGGSMIGGAWDALPHPDDFDADWTFPTEVDITGEFKGPYAPTETRPWPE